MTPLTEHEEITRRTYNQLAKQWRTGHISRGFWEEELKLFKKLLPGGKILEIGCGGGRDAKELIELGYDYLGTDISEELLKEASKYNPKGKFEHKSLYDLDFTELFDGFWCSAVLLHIPRKRIGEALQSIKKNMKPGAIGFITVKKGKGEGLETRIDLDGEGRLFSYWQNDEFKRVLAEYGFRVVKAGYRPMSERSKWLTYHVKVE